MRTIERSTIFKRDYKREAKGRHRATLARDLAAVLTIIVQNQPLSPRQRDHDLSGDWLGSGHTANSLARTRRKHFHLNTLAS
jgi:mRNA interferase YafQ